MTSAATVLPFAAAIFSGAFLLFLGQPLVGKFILPWYGGGPGVWAACLLFFQGMLLLGYGYAHFLATRLTPRRQALVHAVVLLAALACLPIEPGAGWRPRAGDDPVRSILLLLAATIGIPYVALSATGPLIQHWSSLVHRGAAPWRLYALSNAGSLLALVAYPTLLEPRLPRVAQAWCWSGGMAVFALLCAACAARVWRAGADADADAGEAPAGEADGADGAPGDGVLWVVLPAIASVLLVSTTARLSQDVAAMPLLWILPLAAYLVSFIVCFDHAAWYRRGAFVGLAVAGVAVIWQILASGNSAPLRLQIPAHLVALFAACMVCHGELYRLRPGPRRLTAYYLAVAAGGALGGLAVAVVAPLVLDDNHELPAGLWALLVALGALSFRHRSRSIPWACAAGAVVGVAAIPWLRSRCGTGVPLPDEIRRFLPEVAPWAGALALLAVACLCDPWRRRLLPPWRPVTACFPMLLAAAAGTAFAFLARDRGEPPVERSRNFYGTLEVLEPAVGDERERHRLLVHGATTHGLQLLAPGRTRTATTYYTTTSGVGRAIDSLDDGDGWLEPRRLGLVGLGVGTVAAYARTGDTLRVYEIDPAIPDLARRRFSFLDDCGAEVEVVMGDARLSMERELDGGRPQSYDVLALDAFSSDAIPVHLLTREAFASYLAHLGPDGILAIHVSNRYLDLSPVVERMADHYGLAVVSVSDAGGDEWWMYASTWLLLARDPAVLARPGIADAADRCGRGEGFPLWTDDFASIWPLVTE